jgi:hypothetical protein
MRYYIYISTLKINMLFDQIPLSIKHKVAAELKIDLKLLSATLKNSPTTETTISKLELITKSLEAEGEMGDVWNPKEYFCGVMNMGWGPPLFMHHCDEETEDQMVFFGGSPDNKLMVGLIGSQAHMLGEAGINPVHASYARPSFFRKIAEEIRQIPLKEIEENLYGTRSATRQAAFHWKGETELVEFAAKAFITEENLLVGSPLYVSFAKKPGERTMFSQSIVP